MRLTLSKNAVRGIGLVIAAALLAAGAWLGFALGWPLAFAVLAALAGWTAAAYFRREAAQTAARAETEGLTPLREKLAESEREHAAKARRIRSLLAVNRVLAEASADTLDERGLMDAALAAITGLTGALGCSFVPVDEWHQPLPPFTFGDLPAPVLSAWSTHLASSTLRERCGTCGVLHSTPGGCPLHPAQIGGAMSVVCLPMTGAPLPPHTVEISAGTGEQHDHHSGVLHLYLPAGTNLDPADRALLDSLLPEIATAYEAARLRSQEVSTLRQLRLLHAPENDFSASLGGLLAGLRQALDADLVLLRLRPSADERLSNLTVVQGDAQLMPEPMFDDALDAVLRGGTPASRPGTLPAWLALPLLLPDGAASSGGAISGGAISGGAINGGAMNGGQILGMLVASASRPFIFHPRQQAILQTIAAQAALLVENERMLRSMEYRAVIQERARLAREIHDGLAQTLAFLKLQAAQMQTYLAQGDISRLSRVLKDNYQALAEAYLDTRQAIDNLRLTPQEGLESWIERTLREFESGSGLRVEWAISPLTRAVAPEVQAHLIRIVQESLSNVRKHARASLARVSLYQRGGDLLLEITDDGIGFEAGDVPEISRHGLRGMRERAEMIGADIQVISQPSHGVTVRLTLPAWEEESTP